MPESKPYSKTILCLANSRRPGGHCFAGRELRNGKLGGWIRPINAKHGNAVSDRDRQYADKSMADLLDIVSVPMLGPRPQGHHQEDHQIQDEHYWTKIGRATWNQIIEATQNVAGTLWPNEDHSFHGVNDKVSEATTNKQTGSLLLIAPKTLDLVVGQESQYGGGSRRRVRAHFKYNSIGYNLVVTDPWVEDRYFANADGRYPIEGSRLCISLPEVINGNSTKLVAAVITKERVD